MEKLLVLALATAAVCPTTTASTECKDKQANQRYYYDCKDAFEHGERCSGVYKVKPEVMSNFSVFVCPPFDVYCDMESDGGGWTVFQRRINGTQDFYLNWIDYVHGFGDVNDEFWLGLINMHHLTASPTELRVDLADFDCNMGFAKYNTFSVSDPDSKFALTVSGYSGTAGDSLTYNNNSPFSTKDQDNDLHPSVHCAQDRLGAWWYNSCSFVNLNGHYYMGPASPQWKGVVWYQWRGSCYSLKATEMKLRRV